MVSSYSGILSRNVNYCTSNVDEPHKPKADQKKPAFIRVRTVGFNLYHVQNQVKQTYSVRSQDSSYSGEEERS